MLTPIFTRALQLLASAAVRETLLILAAYGLIRLLKPGTAAFRHWTWNLALIGGLVIPLLAAISPVWSVPVLPAFQNNVPPAASSFKTDPRLLEQNPASENPQVKARALASSTTNESSSLNLSAPAKKTALRSAPVSLTNAFSLRDWPLVLLAIWAFGVVAVIVYVFRQQAHVRRITAKACPLTEPGWAQALRHASATLHLTRPVKLLISDQITIPMTWGWRQPVIMLPLEAREWTTERRQVVLLHELAHIVRGDWLTQWLALSSCAVNWFNPLVWRAAHLAHTERERACDDLVLRAGVAGSDYSGHLLDIARGLHSRRPLPARMFLAMAHQSDLAQRINSILSQRHQQIFT